MTQYSKINVIYRLQRWIDSVPGQTFLNYAYSWGASIVILGTLFKLTHLPGANLMLYIGMGTEVVVFFISAFDRPFDKTAIGKELPTHISDSVEEDTVVATSGQPIQGGGTLIIQQGVQSGAAETAVAGSQTAAFAGHNTENDNAKPYIVNGNSQPVGVQTITADAATAPQQSSEMVEATAKYVDELKRLTDTLAKVSEQSTRLTKDSEEMENLNRTLTGISRVYEMQLKSASSQIGTIDQINEQSRKMAEQIEQLNSIYARMIDAMTVSMHASTRGNNGREA